MAKLSTELIAKVKRQLEQLKIDLSGDCGAFQITKRVVWAAREGGVGLLSKPNGAGCDGFAAGFVCFQDTSGIDILGDAGGANSPQMDVRAQDPALQGRWRAPFNPGDTDNDGNIMGAEEEEKPLPDREDPTPENLEGRCFLLENEVKALQDLFQEVINQIALINQLQANFGEQLRVVGGMIPTLPGYAQVGRIGNYLLVKKM